MQWFCARWVVTALSSGKNISLKVSNIFFWDVVPVTFVTIHLPKESVPKRACQKRLEEREHFKH